MQKALLERTGCLMTLLSAEAIRRRVQTIPHR
jgi:hypothetical protein